MKKVKILKEFVDVSDFAKRYMKDTEAYFEDERAEYLASKGLVELETLNNVQNKMLAPEDVISINQARGFLRRKNIAFCNTIKYDEIIELASKNGIVFPNLKKGKL